MKNLDGVSQWKTILYDVPSLRSHVLHNIDDQLGYAALRKENWKLVKGLVHFKVIIFLCLGTSSIRFYRDDLRW